MCEDCYRHVSRKSQKPLAKPPSLSLANGTWTNTRKIPDALFDLTPLEQLCLGLRRCVGALFSLKPATSRDGGRDVRQHAIKGHWLNCSQNISELVKETRRVLPLPPELSLSVQVRLVDRNGRTDFVRDELVVCRARMKRAWEWLRLRNPYHSNVA